MRLVLLTTKDKTLSIYEDRVVLASYIWEDTKISPSAEFIEEIRVAEYKEKA